MKCTEGGGCEHFWGMHDAAHNGDWLPWLLRRWWHRYCFNTLRAVCVRCMKDDNGGD